MSSYSFLAVSGALTFAALTALTGTGTALSGWAFLTNQTDCRLSCQNGGVCAFDRDTPYRHKCICFVGMFYGEQCEFVVSEEDINHNDGGSQSSSSSEEDEAANGALKAGISAPDNNALTPVEDSDSPYTDSGGIGGSLNGGGDIADAVLPDVDDDNERDGSRSPSNVEDPSYESESGLNGAAKQEESTLAPPTTTANVREPGAVADEVELLRNEEAHKSAYSLDGDNVHTRAADANDAVDNERLRDNVLAPHSLEDSNTAAPTALQQDLEEQQRQKQMEAQIHAPIDTTLPLGASDGMGGNFLAGNDEFHGTSNIKRYEEQPRTTQAHYGNADSAKNVPHRREKTLRKHYRERMTTTTTPAPSEDESVYDDGWMISAKGRREIVNAPSAATQLLTSALLAVAVLFGSFSLRHFIFYNL